jgi:AraC family transcriptional regulator, positive regulator of tynA and feaB
MESFSTAGLSGRRKVSFWNDISSETFAPMEVSPADRERFDGVLYRERVGSVALAEVCSAAGVVHHTDAHIARADDRGYTLIMPIDSPVNVATRLKPRFELAPGDICIVDQCRPYSLTLPQFTRTFCVALDGSALRDVVPDAARIVGVHMRPATASARVLSILLRQLSQELVSGGTHAMSPTFAQCLTGLVAAAYAEIVEPDASSVLLSRKLQIRQYVEERLHDPQLRPSAVAEHFGISARYLRLIFESGGEPLSAYVLRRRLEKCAQLLRDRAWSGQTITEIAFRNGFGNLTHFGSAFRKRFGLAPRDYRHPG